MHIIADFIRESISTTGTGATVALSGAVDDSRTFASAMADGDTCDYYIEDPGVGREAGVATYVSASNELTLAVRASTNSNNRISLSGSAKIGISFPGNKTKARETLQVSALTRTITTTATITVADQGKSLRFTGTPPYTDTLDPAADLGSDFQCFYSNETGGVVTLSSTSDINGSSSDLAIPAGQTGRINSDGTNIYVTAASTLTGMLSWWPLATPPSGWLERDGSAISRTTYSDLFAVIGTMYGTGDGSTTFNIPDDRGEFIRGWDNGRGVDSGRAIGSTQLDQMQRTTGRAQMSTSNGALGIMDTDNHPAEGVFNPDGATGSGPGVSAIDPSAAWRLNFDSALSPNVRTSSTTSGETRARNRAYMPIIKY